MKFPGGRNLCEIGKEKSFLTRKSCSHFLLVGGVQARLFESSSVKKGGESSEAKQLLYSSSFFLQDFNRRKISSTQFFLPARFQPKKNLINPILSSRKISTEEKSHQPNSFFLQNFNRSPLRPHSMGVK